LSPLFIVTPLHHLFSSSPPLVAIVASIAIVVTSRRLVAGSPLVAIVTSHKFENGDASPFLYIFPSVAFICIFSFFVLMVDCCIRHFLLALSILLAVLSHSHANLTFEHFVHDRPVEILVYDHDRPVDILM
jgi:hypothetical protein